MAGYRALAATGRSIVDLLNRRVEERIPVPPRPRAVLAGATDFDGIANEVMPQIQRPGLSVYCYGVDVDPETRPGWAGVTNADGRPRLPVRMHLMVSAWDTTVQSELEWLGLAGQILESEPILTGPLLHPSGDWNPGETVQVVSDDVALESKSEAFQALNSRYRLSLFYLARVVVIEGPRGPLAEPVGLVAARTETLP